MTDTTSYPQAIDDIPTGAPGIPLHDPHLAAHNVLGAGLAAVQQTVGLEPARTLTEVAGELDDLRSAVRIRWQRTANIAGGAYTDVIASALPPNEFVAHSTVGGNARLSVLQRCWLDLLLTASATNAAGGTLRLAYLQSAHTTVVDSQGGGIFDGAIGWSGAPDTYETIDLQFRAGPSNALWTFRGQITARPLDGLTTNGTWT